MPSVLHSQRTTCPRCRAVFNLRLSECPHDGARLRPLPQDALLGATLAGRYVIASVLRDGRLARTYLATEVGTGERRLIKVMYGDYVGSRRERARFAREAFVGRYLNHPNVLAVTDSGESDSGVPFLVTRFERGEMLADIIQREAPLSTERICALLPDIIRGIEHIHRGGVILRGLGSDAVLISDAGETERALITSFAFASDNHDLKDNKVTRMAKLVGRASYMSPEQGANRPVDARTDYYSLGVVLYEMLSGKVPFEGAPMVVAMRHSFERPPRISERVPGLTVNSTLEAIVLRLLRKDPAQRYQSADALLSALSMLRDN